MRRVSERLAHPLACAIFLAAGLSLPAAAAPADDYLAAKANATAAALAAAKAGKADDQATIKREEAALADLGKRMTALIGPVALKGLGAPAYTVEILAFDDQPNPQLDGIALADPDETTRVVISPEPVFQKWLAARAADKDAPAEFGTGLAAAAMTPYFFNTAVINGSGGFTPYVALPVAAGPDETVYASLGLYSDEPPANSLPDTLTVVRVANGQVRIGVTQADLDIDPIAACDTVWMPYGEKIDRLQQAAEKANDESDPRWEEIAKAYDAGAEAFRACFTKAAKDKPFLTEAAKRAEALLKTMRGN